jgi:UDP-4-amino-4,6-dideoxy-N-acetyl-beta-L-altrosamine N-acetyltransferase
MILMKKIMLVTNVVLREITRCDDATKKAVRDVRNQPEIRKSMYTEHIIILQEHLAWVDRMSNDKQQIVFIVLVDDVVGGIVSINLLDRLHLKSNWAFYLDKNMPNGLGPSLECVLIKFAFNELGLEKLNCEVIETNDRVVKLHKKFGFMEEGFRRENIIKDRQRIGVFFLGLTKSDWIKCEGEVLAKYKRVIEKFNIQMEY